jgi:hypothetical protein
VCLLVVGCGQHHDEQLYRSLSVESNIHTQHFADKVDKVVLR